MRGIRTSVLPVLLWSFTAFATEFQIGPDTTLDSLSICGGNQNYLVVWRDLRDPAAPQMRGSLVTLTGMALPDFAISDAGGQPLEGPVQRPTVAFDGTNFIVVWVDNRAQGAGVRGAIVTPQGSVSGGADFRIAATSRTDNVAPQIVFAGGDLLVAWQDGSTTSGVTGSQIFYAKLTSAGAVNAQGALPSTSGQDQKLELLISGPAGEQLVVWQDIGATPNVTRGTRIQSGVLAAPTGGIYLFQRDFTVNGLGVPVGGGFDKGEYQVLSSLGAQIDSSVYKTRVQLNNTVIRASAPLAEVAQGATGLAEDSFPRTFFNGAGASAQYLFLRNSKVSDIAYHLYLKRVQTDTTDLDPNPSLLDSAQSGVENGAVAANVGTQYLVAWMDGRRGTTQPARQLNIYGVLVDSTRQGDTIRPYIKAVAHGSPLFGSSPLVVNVSSVGSTGIVDKVVWNFGDGNTAETTTASNTYYASGQYTVVLSLIHAGLIMRDFILISVDQNGYGGGGGPAQVTAGVLGPVSTSVRTDVLISTLSGVLNFAKANADSLRLSGYIDPSNLPVLPSGTPVSFSMAGRQWSFTLGSTGTFVSSGSTSVVRLSTNWYTGAFALSITSENLASGFAPLGATNSTIGKPGSSIALPFSFSLDKVSLNATINATYIATAGKSGKINYAFGRTGSIDTGLFRISAAQAVQSGKVNAPVHAFTLIGFMAIPNSAEIVAASTGAWRITLGNLTTVIPVSALTQSKKGYSYRASGGNTGLLQFYYLKSTGQFGLLYKKVDATGDNPSGMPLANVSVHRADMALSLDFDLQSGTSYQASGYVRFGRATYTAKKWKQR